MATISGSIQCLLRHYIVTKASLYNHLHAGYCEICYYCIKHKVILTVSSTEPIPPPLPDATAFLEGKNVKLLQHDAKTWQTVIEQLQARPMPRDTARIVSDICETMRDPFWAERHNAAHNAWQVLKNLDESQLSDFQKRVVNTLKNGGIPPRNHLRSAAENAAGDGLKALFGQLADYVNADSAVHSQMRALDPSAMHSTGGVSALTPAHYRAAEQVTRPPHDKFSPSRFSARFKEGMETLRQHAALEGFAPAHGYADAVTAAKPEAEALIKTLDGRASFSHNANPLLRAALEGESRLAPSRLMRLAELAEKNENINIAKHARSLATQMHHQSIYDAESATQVLTKQAERILRHAEHPLTHIAPEVRARRMAERMQYALQTQIASNNTSSIPQWILDLEQNNKTLFDKIFNSHEHTVPGIFGRPPTVTRHIEVKPLTTLPPEEISTLLPIYRKCITTQRSFLKPYQEALLAPHPPIVPAEIPAVAVSAPPRAPIYDRGIPMPDRLMGDCSLGNCGHDHSNSGTPARGGGQGSHKPQLPKGKSSAGWWVAGIVAAVGVGVYLINEYGKPEKKEYTPTSGDWKGRIEQPTASEARIL
jgi:hypothetical protein